MNRFLILLVTPLLVSAGAAYAQEPIVEVGVKLSPRELAVSRPVKLPDGRVVLRPVNDGDIPWLFGLGDVYGAPSGLPTVNGVTPSVLASTPSGGLVPGQEPR